MTVLTRDWSAVPAAAPASANLIGVAPFPPIDAKPYTRIAVAAAQQMPAKYTDCPY